MKNPNSVPSRLTVHIMRLITHILPQESACDKIKSSSSVSF